MNYDFLAEGQETQPQHQTLAMTQWRPPEPTFGPGSTLMLGALGLAAGGIPGAVGAVLITRVGNSLGQTLWDDIKSDAWRKPLTVGAVGGLAVGGLVGYMVGKKR